MSNHKKMTLVGERVSFAKAEESDLFFWANKSAKERLDETERLRRMIWTHILGNYPDKMEKIGSVVSCGCKSFAEYT